MEQPKKLTGAKVLVTGGAGFIGSNLIDALLKQDNEVVCLDNFATGKRENLVDFEGHSNFTLIEGDIREEAVCRQAVRGVDYILHQAALGSVPRSIKDPKTSNEVNVSGFLNMLIAAKDEKVKRFVYASSSSVYGDHPELPKVEERLGKPLSPYAVTKYTNELYAKVFSDTYGLPTIGLRYFNVFGMRQDPSSVYAAVIPKFIKALITGEPLVINGDGSHSRDFTFVENVVQANQLAVLTENPEALNTVYNVACGGQVTLVELVEQMKAQLSAFKPEIRDREAVFGPERPGDIQHSWADISKAGNLLNYTPEYQFSEGLKKALNWYWNAFNKN
jgi:UDP-N-acetylglucosamine/UDP-N-acetylgalactosamine 4-epimerase